jgi:putative two-component system response regulator
VCGLDSEACKTLERGGYLHDVGKVGVPDAVLLKNGPLTREEFAIMKRHPEIGDALCTPLRSLKDVRPIVRHHHERLDGSGYPDRLRGDEIPLLAQIVSVVDMYDALTTTRPYRGPLSREAAIAELMMEVRSGRVAGYLVDAMIAVLDQPVTTETALVAGAQT